MSKTTPLDRITSTLDDLHKLQRASDLLRQVAGFISARDYE